MSIMKNISSYVKTTTPSKFEVGYGLGAVVMHGLLTRSLRRTAGVAAEFLMYGAIDNVVIPTVSPLVVKAWERLKEVVTTRSFTASVHPTTEQPAVAQ